ncbi:hypothetical protein BH11BAC7_BH11BAC7_23250 [soil metagenome]
MKRIIIVFFILISVAGFSKDAGDSLWSRNSIRVDVGGKALLGIGITFERSLIKKDPEKHSRAFTSVEAGMSFNFVYTASVMPGLGINRNWYLFKNRLFIADAGIYIATKISFNPSPKEIRDMYKGWNSIPENIDYPVEPCLFGQLGVRMIKGRWFFNVSLTPLLYYHRIYAHKIDVIPWAGISAGFKI